MEFFDIKESEKAQDDLIDTSEQIRTEPSVRDR